MPHQPAAYSIVIPVFNEQERIQNCLDQLDHYLGSKSQPEQYQIIFVNDGSTDQTESIIAKWGQAHLLLNQPTNQGKGWAVRAGMLQATGKLRAFIDADMATPADQLDKLFAELATGADIAIGSRITKDGVDLRLVGKKPQSFSRRVLGKLFRLLATRPFLGNIRDSQCGAKAFTGPIAEQLFQQQQIKRWSFDIEILYLAKKHKAKVVEVPVDWSAQDNSKLQPSISLAWSILKELAAIAWTHR